MSRNYSAIYHSIHSHIMSLLRTGLPQRYTYHSIEHTADVLEQVQEIAAREGISNERQLLLLKVAALYHDTGFLFVYSGHEARGCELAQAELPGFGFTPAAIKKICGMIMATKIPQSPKNKLEEIICDADLDYLGRGDFEPISNTLYQEFLDIGIVKDHDGWMQMQIKFLESHHYFTKSSQALRHPPKKAQLDKLKALHQPGNE